MLNVKDLCFRYSRNGAPVLQGASLTLQQGEVGILLGKNGSGKTTLFKNILGIEKPDSGTITFDGEELLKMPHMVCTERFLQYAQSIYDLKFYKTPTGIAAAGPRFTAEVLPEDLSDAPYAMLKTAQSIPNAYLGFGLE